MGAFDVVENFITKFIVFHGQITVKIPDSVGETYAESCIC